MIAIQRIWIGENVSGNPSKVGLVYVRTAAMLGALGAVTGIALRIAISNLAARFFGMEFWAVDVGLGVDPTVVAASAFVGLAGPPLAALPAIRPGVRTDLREALHSTGSVVGGQGRLDRALRHLRFLPRTMQLGLRGVGRRRHRSFATC